MSEKDRIAYWNIKADPKKYVAYLKRKKAEQKARRLTPEGKEYERMRKARWRAANPDKTRAIRDSGHAVEKALKKGKLVRPKTCQKCGRGKPEAHHHKGYAKRNWLKVEWLCAPCHQGEHARQRSVEEKGAL